MTSKFFPIATGALYVRKYFSESSKATATEMVTAIKAEFETILHSVDWMDHKTRAEALSKVEKMDKHIGYPNELMDDKKLIEYYEEVQIDEKEYLQSVLNLYHFRLTTETKKFREAVNKTDWRGRSEVAIANAFYQWLENSISEFADYFKFLKHFSKRIFQ
jgi:predicted metalloendopeptidase